MVKDSEPSFLPERTKLIVITYSVSDLRPLKVLLKMSANDLVLNFF